MYRGGKTSFLIEESQKTCQTFSMRAIKSQDLDRSATTNNPTYL